MAFNWPQHGILKIISEMLRNGIWLFQLFSTRCWRCWLLSILFLVARSWKCSSWSRLLCWILELNPSRIYPRYLHVDFVFWSDKIKTLLKNWLLDWNQKFCRENLANRARFLSWFWTLVRTVWWVKATSDHKNEFYDVMLSVWYPILSFSFANLSYFKNQLHTTVFSCRGHY